MFGTARITARRAVVVAAIAGGLLAAGAGAAFAAQPTTAPPAPSLSQGSTGITMLVKNTTNDEMTLISASNPYGHWQQRPTSVPGPGSTVASDYSDNIEGAEIDLQFQMPNGAIVNMDSDAPLAGTSSAWGDVDGSGYTVTWTHSGSFHTLDTYTVSYG